MKKLLLITALLLKASSCWAAQLPAADLIKKSAGLTAPQDKLKEIATLITQEQFTADGAEITNCDQ